METIGQRFKKIRVESGLTQSDFGIRTGLSKSAVSAVENDKSFVSHSIMRTIFMEFNVNLNWLICGEGSMFNYEKDGAKSEEIFAEIEKIVLNKSSDIISKIFAEAAKTLKEKSIN